MGRVSRNSPSPVQFSYRLVTPRMGRVSRNPGSLLQYLGQTVTPRMGRVSRNCDCLNHRILKQRHAPHGACE